MAVETVLKVPKGLDFHNCKSRLLSYDLKGQFKEAINIRSYIPKCIFRVNSADSSIKLVKLKDSINEEKDNNYIMYAKCKK